MDAPFVLQDLGCSGSEERLVDCPGAIDDQGVPYLLDYQFEYYAQQARACNPDRQPFAYVACGTITAQGTTPAYISACLLLSRQSAAFPV